MSLSDAAAEFARQLVTALAGDAGRPGPTDADVRVLRKAIHEERAARRRAETERDRLRGAVWTVLAEEGDLLSADRAQLLRDALGEPG